jgi:hypothetical protein
VLCQAEPYPDGPKTCELQIPDYIFQKTISGIRNLEQFGI